MKMMPETNEQLHPRPRPKQKSGLWSKIIILTIILLIVGSILFIFISIKYPTALEEGNETQVATPTVPSEGFSSSTKLVFIIIVIGVIIIVGYLVLKSFKPSGSKDIPKIPVQPDRAEELFIENFILRNEVQSIYDGTKKLYKPANKNSISLINKQPYFHTATGDNFLMIEIEVSEGKRQGIHMVILPIDKGEEIIKGGWYRIDTNTPKHTFQLNRNNYPMSSMADKSDRMKLAMIDREEDKEKATEVMKSMASNNPNTISTPLDAYGGEQSQLPPRRIPLKRSRYSRRRY